MKDQFLTKTSASTPLVNKKNTLKGIVAVVVGSQWGDEGKGKWIDKLAPGYDIVVRFQGGNNAGHTLFIDEQKVVLHQLPSGIFHKDQIAMLSAGVVIDPAELVVEMAKVGSQVELEPEKVWISSRAHVITPWHVFVDGLAEESAENPIGTTKRGIGPTYSDKAGRLGMRMEDFVSSTRRSAWITRMKQAEPKFAAHLSSSTEEWALFDKAAVKLAPFVCEAEERLRRSLSEGKSVLLEGAQGTLLDINAGTYPYVTSSNTISGGGPANLGFAPQLIQKSIGIAKAYTTRVGEGPFPTELKDFNGEELAQKGNEFGATTGRPRRCGWLDAVALRYACEVNGFTEIYLNKMDIISGFPEVKICVAYEHPVLGKITYFPSSSEVLSQCRPVYETYPGWAKNIPKQGSTSDLPEHAQNFLQKIEELCLVEISHVGTGPERMDFLTKAGNETEQ